MSSYNEQLHTDIRSDRHAMSDTGQPPEESPFIRPATGSPQSPEIESADVDGTDESLTDLLAQFVATFRPAPEIDLETIRERTTVRNVINYRKLDEHLDSGWAVDPEIVKFGDEPLADALVFSHYRRSYDIILKPADIFLPTDEIELFIHDRSRGIRHKLVRTTPSLDRALEHTVSTLTHSHFNPDAPYLASLLVDEHQLVEDDAVDEAWEDVFEEVAVSGLEDAVSE